VADLSIVIFWCEFLKPMWYLHKKYYSDKNRENMVFGRKKPYSIYELWKVYGCYWHVYWVSVHVIEVLLYVLVMYGNVGVYIYRGSEL